MRIISLIILIMFTSCLTPKEVRKKRRALNKIERLDLKSKKIALEHGLLLKDTAKAVVQYVVQGTKVDTIFSHSTDTLTIHKDNLKIEYIKTPYEVYIKGECDTVIIHDTLEIPIDVKPKIVEKPLSGWQKAKMKTGEVTFIALLVLLGVLLIKYRKLFGIPI